jgi:hypothetical protein
MSGDLTVSHEAVNHFRAEFTVESNGSALASASCRFSAYAVPTQPCRDGSH